MEQNKRQWMLQTANIINVLLHDNPISDEFSSIHPNDDFFVDSCNYVNLRYELRELEDTLRNMIRYSDMSKGVDK